VAFVVAAPELLGSAASDLANLAGSLSSANAAAATGTTVILAAAEDEVSAAIATLFSGHAHGGTGGAGGSLLGQEGLNSKP
jgi:hypothetical protein